MKVNFPNCDGERSKILELILHCLYKDCSFVNLLQGTTNIMPNTKNKTSFFRKWIIFKNGTTITLPQINSFPFSPAYLEKVGK